MASTSVPIATFEQPAFSEEERRAALALLIGRLRRLALFAPIAALVLLGRLLLIRRLFHAPIEIVPVLAAVVGLLFGPFLVLLAWCELLQRSPRLSRWSTSRTSPARIEVHAAAIRTTRGIQERRVSLRLVGGFAIREHPSGCELFVRPRGVLGRLFLGRALIARLRGEDAAALRAVLRERGLREIELPPSASGSLPT